MPVEWSNGDCLVAIDPGLHTGIAVGSIGPNGIELEDTAEFVARNVNAERAVCREMAEWILGSWTPKLVIIEDFILGFGGDGKVGVSSKREGLSPVRMGFGLFVALQYEYCSGVHEGWNQAVKWQTPAQKATITDERLKSKGLYDRSSGAHIRDAVRHLVIAERAGIPV